MSDKKKKKSKKKITIDSLVEKYKGKISLINTNEEYKQIDSSNAYSFGSLYMNYQMSGNFEVGMPKGKVIEIYGLEGTFKTLVLMMVYVDVQKQGYKVLHVNGERSWNNALAEKCGIDLSNVILINAEDAEETFDIVFEFANNISDLNIGMIGIDSLDSLVPKVILQGTMDENSMGVFARLMGRFLRKIVGILDGTNATLICINQVRYKIGGYGGQQTRPGGIALHFYAWINIQLKVTSKDLVKKTDRLTKEIVQIGAIVNAEAKKSRQYPPFRKAKFFVEYGKPINKIRDLIETCILFGAMAKGPKKKVIYHGLNDGKAVTLKKLMGHIKDNKLYKTIFNELIEKEKEFNAK